ncbi:hypothetical protein P7C70_g7362, partial [Phenoliferia sp. Uapishka_3]
MVSQLAALPLPAAASPSSPSTCSLLDPLPLITPVRAVRTLTRDQIAFAITRGHVLVIHRGFVYRLNSFLKNHPGGALPVLHYVGRDATDEIEAYHPVFALKRMKNFVCGKVDSADWPGEEVLNSVGWKPLVPPLHLGWSNLASSYENVGTLDETLALLKEGGENIAKLAGLGSPAGTELPFLAANSLEPPPPPAGLDPAEQHRLAISFRKFRRELLQVPGLFENNPWELYKSHIYRCAALFTSFITFYLRATQKWHYAVSAISLGFFMHQIMYAFTLLTSSSILPSLYPDVPSHVFPRFVAHDAGHTEITGDRFKDKVIGCVIAAYASGMSLGWWVSQHDVHHMVTNHPEHDPDIQLFPFFAFTPRFFDSLYSTFHACTMYFDAPTRFLLQYQHLHFYPIMVFARFSLFGKSYHFVRSSSRTEGITRLTPLPPFCEQLVMKAKANNWRFRTFELVGVVFFWTWYTLLVKNMGSGLDGWITRVMYTVLVLLAVCPIHIQIVLSHSAQDTTDMGVYESFVHRQLRTTMDVSCPDYLDFVHGGLHMQVVHHMFPRLPRPNLRPATVLAKQWAAANGLEYREKNFTEGNKELRGLLAEIAGQVRALASTADDLAKGRIEME